MLYAWMNDKDIMNIKALRTNEYIGCAKSTIPTELIGDQRKMWVYINKLATIWRWCIFGVFLHHKMKLWQDKVYHLPNQTMSG